MAFQLTMRKTIRNVQPELQLNGLDHKTFKCLKGSVKVQTLLSRQDWIRISVCNGETLVQTYLKGHVAGIAKNKWSYKVFTWESDYK